MGGIFVLGSYTVCLSLYPEHREELWGGVYGRMRRLFVLSMGVAAVGYLIFSHIFVFDILSSNSDAVFHLSFYSILALTVIFLLFATLWMPASMKYLNTRQNTWLVLSLASLWVTALSLLSISAVTGNLIVNEFSNMRNYMALAGLSYMTFHCLVLDAILWGSLFNR